MIRAPRLSVDRQIALMRIHWSGLETRRRGGGLKSVGLLHPSVLTGEYLVRIEYRFGWLPSTFVDSPLLIGRPGQLRVPHTYGPDQPCLFYPKRREWSSTMAIANTIVPWLAEWLVFYELWHVTGSWLGGGIHPGQATTTQMEEDPEWQSTIRERRSLRS